MLNISYLLVRSTVMEFLAAREGKKEGYKVLTRQKQKHQDAQTWRRSQLTQQHLDFLVDAKTLRSWQGMTM